MIIKINTMHMKSSNCALSIIVLLVVYTITYMLVLLVILHTGHTYKQYSTRWTLIRQSQVAELGLQKIIENQFCFKSD